MKIARWEHCYDSSWKGFITPESFSHPAKYARGLIERIFDHCLERGYLGKGDVVGDCFGGIGTGGIIAAYRGIVWRGVELEPKFVTLAQANFALHRSKIDVMGLPHPRIIQGDSRRFHEIVCDVSAMISSPPFTQGYQSGGGINKNGYGPDGKDKVGSRTYQGQGGERTSGNIETLKEGSVQGVISSPPYAVISTGAGGLNTKPAKHAGQQSGRSASAASQDTDQKYGQAPGQIAALKEGSVAGVISSPPYADSVHDGNGIDASKLTGNPAGPNSQAGNEGYGETAGQIGALKSGSVDGVVSSPPFRDARSDTAKSHPTKHGGPCADRHHTTQAGAGYGETAGQIDNLSTGDVHAVVTSPPWEKNAEGSRKGSKMGTPEKILACSRGHGASDAAVLAQAARDEQKTYGDSPGQIGKESSETYWQAMDAVYRSCFKAIRPGGVLILVLKDYVKAKKRVPLCDDTVRLIEHIGFTMVERIHAMLVKETRHEDLFLGPNGFTTTSKSRKSFFRRLTEKKGSPAIDYEEVLIARRP